ncbi:MAG: site-specific DNA-methyltransferase [Bacteroidota bacterium]|nr:site-specific DNA-methyltransferase [Bacteroidota bacterium]
MPKPARPVESYTHENAERLNNPPAGLATAHTDPDVPATAYTHDPHIDPFLSWAGKADRLSFEVPTVSLHVHETIDPRTIIEQVQKTPGEVGQLSMFDQPRPLREAIDFYQHQDGWANRMIAGDSLVVMNNLLQKESMAGKVQMIYLDPPYGIKYGSNFQPFVNNRDVVDGKAGHLTAEPEQIQAFRDTWEMGIHSYLNHLRDRFLLAKELLTERGSIFVQMGKENVLRVGLLLDEIFGAENRVAMITYATSGGSSANTLPEVADYLLCYARDRAQVKYRQLYERLTRREVVELFNWGANVELPDGSVRGLTDDERQAPDRYLPLGARLYQRTDVSSQGWSTTGRSAPFVWNGVEYPCRPNSHWRVSHEGLERLAALGRLDGRGGLRWKRYEEELPGRRLHNIWRAQSQAQKKQYVVQTARKLIQRCMLMATDPGDLVLDPTCGSGTTAFVAEQWGRRWISCDTSRVAIAIARKRLMTAHYDYYKLKRPNEGVDGGIVHKMVESHSAKTLAYDLPPKVVTLYDQPYIDRKRARVTGPFTIEAVPAPTVTSVAAVLESQRGTLLRNPQAVIGRDLPQGMRTGGRNCSRLVSAGAKGSG